MLSTNSQEGKKIINWHPKKKIKKKKPLNGVLQTETMKTQGAMKDRDSAGSTTEANQMVSVTSFGF